MLVSSIYWRQLKSTYKRKIKDFFTLFHSVITHFPLVKIHLTGISTSPDTKWRAIMQSPPKGKALPTPEGWPRTNPAAEMPEAIPGKWFHIIKNSSNFSFLPHSKHQHSTVLIMKSSVSVSWGLSKVLQGCVLPWYRSPSNHSPKLPLKIKNK